MYLKVKTIVLASFVALAGCSETGFQDVFDSGKFSPDETQVKANRSLTLPPDLQLRAPGNGATQPAPQTNGLPPVNAQPPQYANAPQTTVPRQQQAYVPPANQPVVTRRAPQDIYDRWGISKTRPDGSKKSEAELLEEVRAKKKAKEQAKNPQYGTIFNLPKVWSDSQQ